MIKIYKYEITKYNTKYRNYKTNPRTYLKNEWTGISDIGKKFDDGILTSEQYTKVEDMYIYVVDMILKYKKLDFLFIKDVIPSFSNENFKKLIQTQKDLYTDNICSLYYNVVQKTKLNKSEILDCCRLLLREDISAEIFYPNKLKIFIGYDYLMSIHSSNSLNEIIPKIKKIGLFTEIFE